MNREYIKEKGTLMSDNNLKDAQKSFQTLSRLLSDIAKLNKKRDENLVDLKSKTFEARTLLQTLIDVHAIQSTLDELDGFAETLEGEETIDPAQYGVELSQQLKEIGISLSGQYPDLKAGLFQMEVNFEQGSTTVWYGPKQERITRCSLQPSAVSDILKKTQQNMGSQLSPEEFRDKLKEAYLLSVAEGQPAPIVRVMSFFVWAYQGKKYHIYPTASRYTEYTRMDFSYDLLRLRENLLNQVRLTVATRSETADHGQYLWIPDDAKSGKGTRYSHLQFRS